MRAGQPPSRGRIQYRVLRTRIFTFGEDISQIYFDIILRVAGIILRVVHLKLTGFTLECYYLACGDLW